jgi:peroxiredoxin
MRVDSTFTLKPGDIAPDFSLPDADGRHVTLQEASGPHGILVIFGCNHCPFVIHLADALSELAARAFACGIGTVVINSNDLDAYPQDGPEFMKTFAREHAWDFPYLIDATQDVAKQYGAACTPDFFLFDSRLGLHYAGQFDASRPKNGSVADGSDLQAAIDGMLAGSPPPAKVYPSSGCNIKWKPGQAPSWFPG